jgi:hypothetical protein
MSSAKKTGLCALVTAILLWLIRDRLHFDPATYSAGFADQETHLGVPNFWNVATNLGFAVLGLAGMAQYRRYPEIYRGLGAAFAAAILGVAFGSSYFHYAPSPTTLFWDQLPMSVGFAIFTGMVIADRASPKVGRIVGIVLSVAGAVSVWNIYYGNGATEYYLAVQFGSLIFAILTLLATPRNRMRTSLIFVGLVAYIVAKVLETNDHRVFDALKVVSGHSLKHVAATLALWAIFRGAAVERAEARA